MSTHNRLARLAMTGMIAAVLAACAGSPTRESTGEYIDDTLITSKVKAKLVESSDVSAAAVNVETFKGIVQLSGFASSTSERVKAEELARGVEGVKQVKNDIRLK
jgi:osmotically-inducible protein OsmY